MKVIKAPEVAWSCKCTCTACEAELLIEKSDVKYQYFSDPRDGGYETWTAACPLCSSQLSVSTRAMSKAVQLEIKQGKNARPTPSGKDFRDGPFEDFYNK